MIFESKTPEYYEWVQSLQYLDNKEDFTSEDSFRIQNGVIVILSFVEKEGYHYHIHPEGYYTIIYFNKDHIRTIYHYDYGINNNPVTHRIFDNKGICSHILSLHQIPTLKEMVVYGEDSKFYNSQIHNIKHITNYCNNNLGYPCIIKPIDQSRGRGIIKIHSKNDLLKYIEDYQVQNKKYIIQEYHSGIDLRIIYLNGEVLSVYERQHPTIIGNGIDNIQCLIESTPAYIHDSESVISHINNQGLQLDQIIEKDLTIRILPTANISSGGSIKTGYVLSEGDFTFIQRIAQAIGSNYFGLDILTNTTIDNGVVLEINKMPGIDGIASALPEFSDFFGSKIRAAIKQSEGIID